MSNEHNSKKLQSVDGNMLKNIILRGKLVMRLMNDPRIGFMYKLIPFASLAYLISPVDFIPAMMVPIIGAADDVAIVLFGFTLFIELCPSIVVDEHIFALTGRVASADDGDIVDGEVSEMD
jgi:uncharacterized membrane protein YkvA (DUF1232 family)